VIFVSFGREVLDFWSLGCFFVRYEEGTLDYCCLQPEVCQQDWPKNKRSTERKRGQKHYVQWARKTKTHGRWGDRSGQEMSHEANRREVEQKQERREEKERKSTMGGFSRALLGVWGRGERAELESGKEG
jgi:hypothetical protein